MNSEDTVRRALEKLTVGRTEDRWFYDRKDLSDPPRVTPVVYRGNLKPGQVAAAFRVSFRNIEATYEGFMIDFSTFEISLYARHYSPLSAVEKDLIETLVMHPKFGELDGPTDSWDESNKWYVRTYSVDVQEG